MYPFIRSCPFFLVERKERSMSSQLLFDPHIGRPVGAAPETTRTALSVEVVCIPLPAGRALRVACVNDALLIIDGYLADDPLRSIARGLSVPLASWPLLRAELDRLAAP
jgi:hypothetical protein